MSPNDWFAHKDQTLPPGLAAVCRRLRELALSGGDGATEEVKYGGVLFAGRQPFCGVFAYAEHVTLEFSAGASLSDPAGELQGKGKGRRHLKFTSEDEAALKRTAHFIALARAQADQTFR